MDKLPYREFLAMLQERTREADIPEIAVRHLGMGACMPQVPDPMAGIGITCRGTGSHKIWIEK